MNFGLFLLGIIFRAKKQIHAGNLDLACTISILLFPIIPESAIKALQIFNLTEKDIVLNSIIDHEYLTVNSKINKIGILFKKIEKIEKNGD